MFRGLRAGSGRRAWSLIILDAMVRGFTRFSHFEHGECEGGAEAQLVSKGCGKAVRRGCSCKKVRRAAWCGAGSSHSFAGVTVRTAEFPFHHEYRTSSRAHLAKRSFGELRIGGIAGNDRDTESSLELGEGRGIACDDGDIGVMRDKRFNHAETEPAATTGDENTSLFECLHD
jgi:hypothetical protein